MSRTWSRRVVLLRAAQAALLAALAPLVGCGPVDHAARLRRHFDYLDIDDEAVERYLTAYMEHRGAPSSRREVEDLHTRFLLSTDFFRNGADESRPVRWVAYYDPYVSPCWNPLARFD